jgi:hypothetical protein
MARRRREDTSHSLSWENFGSPRAREERLHAAVGPSKRYVPTGSVASGTHLRAAVRPLSRRSLLHLFRVQPRPDWEWADLDGRRVVWAAVGKLVSGRLTENGLTHETTLHDFNGMRFERLLAPY